MRARGVEGQRGQHVLMNNMEVLDIFCILCETLATLSSHEKFKFVWPSDVDCFSRK